MLAASALLNRGKQSVYGRPKGLLLFQGSDYMEESQVGENQERIRSALYAHFASCNRKGLVVFDEIQKCAPGILDAFSSLMGTYPYVTDPTNPRKILQIDPSNLLFIFVSDIGKKEMLTLLLQHERREDVPNQRLEVVVRSALDKQWQRLNFGRYIDAVIPFLPLEPVQVQLFPTQICLSFFHLGSLTFLLIHLILSRLLKSLVSKCVSWWTLTKGSCGWSSKWMSLCE